MRSIRTRQGVYPSPNNPVSYDHPGRNRSHIPTGLLQTSMDVPDAAKSKLIREFNPRVSYQDYRNPETVQLCHIAAPGISPPVGFPYLMPPMPAGFPSCVKREPNSVANSNDSESDSDQSLHQNEQSAVSVKRETRKGNPEPAEEVENSSSPPTQTWRPW